MDLANVSVQSVSIEIQGPNENEAPEKGKRINESKGSILFWGP